MISREMLQAMMAKMTGNNYSRPTNFIPPGSNGYNAGRTMDPTMLDQLKRMGMMVGQPVNRELADPNMMQTAERAGMMANPDMRARMMQQMQSAQGMMGNRPANFTPPGSNGYNANRAVNPGMMGGLQAALAAMKSKIMP